MLASLIIVFREVLEAGIITGVVLAATRGMKGRNIFVFGGIAFGIIGACLVALFASTIADSLAGNGQEIFNASVLAIAVAMLAWHNIWMAKHGRQLQQDATALGRAVASGERPLYALAIVVGLAVLREGSEVVLFLYGIVVSSHDSTIAIAGGGVLGVLCGVGVTILLYFSLVRIPMRHLFQVTGWLIAFLAAGLAAQSIAFLAQAGIVTSGQRQLWDTSRIIGDDGIAGRTLHVLFGYTARPTEAQLVVYLLTLATIIGLARHVGQRHIIRRREQFHLSAAE